MSPSPPSPCALVADLEGSRSVEGRSATAETIERALDDLARTWASEWLAPPVTTRGMDEISGLLARPHHAFDIAVRLNEHIWPLRFRFALADGSIDVAADTTDASAMDGPAFHRAADALERAHRMALPMAIELSTLDAIDQALFESTSELIGAITSRWKPSRHAAVRAMRHAATQREAAAFLGVTPQSISAALEAAEYGPLSRAEAALRGLLLRAGRGA